MSAMDDRPTILGSPGERARFSGLLRAALPLGAVLVLCGYALGALNPWQAGLPTAARGAIVLLLAGGIFFATAATQGRVDAFFKGARGEEQVAMLLATLPATYTVLHGVELGKVGLWRGRNLDHLVVGPTGITLVETKNWQGRVTFAEGRLTVNGADPTRSPIDQVRAGARILSAWLAVRLPGAAPVRPLVCFVGRALDGDRIAVDEITLCNSGRLVEAIVSATGNGLDPVTQARVVRLLAQQV
jgi:hypothetical protein